MKIAFLFAVLCSSLIAQAAAENTQVGHVNPSFKEKMILKGNLEASGSFSVGTYSRDKSSDYYIQPSLSYFAMDRLSVGMSTYIQGSTWTDGTSQGLGFGPTASYYFAETENWVFHVTQSLYHSNWKTDYGSSSSESYSTSSTSTIGAKYFITPSVAFGIGLNHTATLQPKENSTDTTDSLTGLFSTYF